MKVKELIELLSKQDPEKDVYVAQKEGYHFLRVSKIEQRIQVKQEIENL